jgi:hypothetical protein
MSMEIDLQDRNAAVVQRAIEGIWNQGDLDLADCLFDSTYVNHGGLITDLVCGPESIKISVAFLRTAFPDLLLKTEQLIATGNTVELHWLAEQHASCADGGSGRSQQPQRLTGTTLCVIVDGKVMESRTDWDQTSAFERLERVPLAPRA